MTKLLNLNTCSYCLLLFLSSPAGTRWTVRYINYSHISNKSSASFADWKEEVVGLAEMTACVGFRVYRDQVLAEWITSKLTRLSVKNIFSCLLFVGIGASFELFGQSYGSRYVKKDIE